MDCKKVRRLLAGYLDDALPSGSRHETHLTIGRHFGPRCGECREELHRYYQLSSLMSQVQRSAPPADLALRIRVAASHRLARSNWLHYAQSTHSAQLIIENDIEFPSGIAKLREGLAVALVVFAMVYQVLGMGMPLGAVTNDSPTSLLQPARLEALAPFSITGLEELGHSGPHALLLEVTVSAEGEAVEYEIISGPDTLAVRRQLDQVLLFSRFRPQMSFESSPTGGGHVVLSFSDMSIKG